MPMDGVTLRKIVDQLRSAQFENVRQIHTPTKSKLSIVFAKKCVTVDLEPGVGVLYLSDRPQSFTDVATPFGNLLRKKLKGARLEKVVQRGSDRVVELVFHKIEDSQELSEYHLVLELMGRNTNAILVKEGRVVDALRRSVTKDRTLMPKAPFEYYPMRGVDFFDPTGWMDRLRKEERILEKALPRVFAGVSRILALEIVARSGLDPHRRGRDLDDRELAILDRTLKEIREEFGSRPGYYLYHNPPEIASIALSIRDDAPIYIEDPSEAVIEYLKLRFSNKSDLETVKKPLKKAIRNRLESRFALLEKLRKEFEETEDLEKLRKKAELIFANAHRLRGKTQEVKLYDWGNQVEVTMKLDPSMTPIENASKMMETYSKLRRKRSMVKKRMKDVEREIEHLESLSAYVELAGTPEDLEFVEDELRELGIVKEKKIKRRSRRHTSSRKESLGKRFSFKGFTVLVGRNNRENDLLRRRAGSRDLWFHARGVPGAHVFLKVNGDPPEEVVHFAARLAATFSRARYDKNVAVDVTEVRHLRKPPKSPPGYVLYDNEETLTVEPLTAEELKGYEEG